MRAGDRRWTAWLQMVVLVPANLIGAVVSFTYFNFVDPLAPGRDDVLAGSVLFFLFGFALLSGLVSVWANRWSRVLDPVDGRVPTSTEARRRALLLPYALAGIVFVAWALAGLLFGVIRPFMLGAFTTERAVRFIFGNTFVAGGATTALTFLLAEHLWRRELPKYFPEGDLSAVPGVIRLRVRARLLVILHLVGVLPLLRLLTADPATPVRLLAREDVMTVTPDTDQEEAARLVAKYDLVTLPIVDRDHRLLGVIGVDNVIDIIREEATEDIQRLAGAAGDETVFDPAGAVFPKRLLWRLINLGTAILAASVIGLFESSIRSLATLAIFMPIVASMGGIGTTQTATVIVRGLALGDMTSAHLWRVLKKEAWLGLTTGIANAAVMAAIAYFWKGQILLAVIIGAALVFNMLVAAVVGVTIPIALKTFRIDPAIASSVIITTFTDVFGFFSFLGLATVLIRFLL